MQGLVKKGSDPFSPTTYYYYSDEGLIAEADSTGTVKVSYGYAPDSIWGTDPLYMRVNGTYHYYFNDHLGTPQQLALKNGAKTWAAVYEAFGKATVTASTITNNLRFPGQYADGETGLHYNWLRYHDSTGRYVKNDPIGLIGGVNGYVYAFNRPLSLIDPFGLYCLSNQAINGLAGAIGGGFSGFITGIQAGNIYFTLANTFLGASVGGVLGYYGTSSSGEAMLAGAASSFASGGTTPGGSLFGGVFGGGLSYELQRNGFSDSSSGIIGGGVGGILGSASTAFFTYSKKIVRPALQGGLSGVAGAALTSGIVEALRYGNNCSECQK